MLRLILAIALLAACLALPAPPINKLKDGPDSQFQKAFLNYDDKNSGFGEGPMGGMGRMQLPGYGGIGGGNMYNGGFDQPGYGFYPQQKRDPYHYGDFQGQDDPFIDGFRGLEGINNDNVDPMDNLINDQDV